MGKLFVGWLGVCGCLCVDGDEYWFEGIGGDLLKILLKVGGWVFNWWCFYLVYYGIIGWKCC